MPLARGDKEYVLPSQGMNTEANLLHFPAEFSPSMLNMEIDFNPQMVRPRKGLDKSGLERLADVRDVNDHKVGITTFLWEGVGQDPDLDFVVVQVAEFLYFFNAEGLSNPTTAVHPERYDLTGALSGTSLGTALLLAPTRVVMSNVKGKLLVTAGQIDPVIISYDALTQTIDPVILNLNIRDMFGIEDGLEIDEHPSTLTDDHKYNLLNQGWYKQRRLTAGSGTESDPIAQYNTVNGEYPSNADIVWVGMVEDTGDLIFDAEWLRDQTFGSSPAARGHYVVDAFDIDRASSLATPSSSGMTSGGSSRIGGGSGVKIGGGASSPADTLL
jgi:hypothetical protein